MVETRIDQAAIEASGRPEMVRGGGATSWQLAKCVACCTCTRCARSRLRPAQGAPKVSLGRGPAGAGPGRFKGPPARAGQLVHASRLVQSCNMSPARFLPARAPSATSRITWPFKLSCPPPPPPLEPRSIQLASARCWLNFSPRCNFSPSKHDHFGASNMSKQHRDLSEAETGQPAPMIERPEAPAEGREEAAAIVACSASLKATGCNLCARRPRQHMATGWINCTCDLRDIGLHFNRCSTLDKSQLSCLMRSIWRCALGSANRPIYFLGEQAADKHEAMLN